MESAHVLEETAINYSNTTCTKKCSVSIGMHISKLWGELNIICMHNQYNYILTGYHVWYSLYIILAVVASMH